MIVFFYSGRRSLHIQMTVSCYCGNRFSYYGNLLCVCLDLTLYSALSNNSLQNSFLFLHYLVDFLNTNT